MKSNQQIPFELPSNKKFGYLISSIATFFCIYFFWVAKEIPSIILGISAFLFVLLALYAPHVLEPLNRIWYNFGLLLGKIVSPIVLSVLFFVLITPVALITRLFGRDTLLLKKRKVLSYWVAKDSMDPESFKKQY